MSDDIFIGNVAVGIVPSAVGLAEKIRAQVVPAASGVGSEWGGKFNEGILGRIGDVMGKWSAEQDTKAKAGGDAAGSSYAEAFKAKLKAATDDLPPVELTANASAADLEVDKLRVKLDELSSKTIGVDLTGEEAMSELNKIQAKMVELRDHPSKLTVEASVQNWQPTLDKMAELREMAAKPIVQKIDIVTGGEGSALAGEASLGAGIAKEVESAGEPAAQGFGTRFMSKITGLIGAGSGQMQELRGGMTEKLGDAGKDAGSEFGGAFSGVLGTFAKVGIPAVVAGAVIAIAAVMGEKLDTAQKQLEVTLHNSGMSWDSWSGKVKAAGAQMTEYGYTQDQVDQSIRAVLQQTGSMTDALGAQTTIANIAAAQHISLASATTQYTRALAGNARALKTLGVQQATGATEAKAMDTAQKMLSSSISQAGGMAQYAAIHHLSLAQAQKLTTAAANGSIPALNKLGIEVLPKSASAAQNYAQVQAVLNARLGGQAAAVADTFGGKIANLRAKFVDIAESVGQKVLPYLERFMDDVLKAVPWLEAWAARIGTWIKPEVTIFLKGLSDTIKFLTTGPMKELIRVLALTAAGVIALNLVLAINPFVALAIAIIFIIGLIDKFHVQIMNGIETAINFVKKIWDDGWNHVKGATHDALSWIEGAFHDTISWIRGAWNDIWSWTVGLLLQDLHAWQNLIHAVFSWIQGAFDNVIRWIRDAWGNLWGWTKDFLLEELHGWQNMLSAVWGWIKGIFHDGLSWVENTWNDAWTKVTNFMSGVWGNIKKGVSSFWGWIKQAFSDGVTALKNIWGGIENAIKGPINWLINTVYNNGIVKIVDGIAGVFGQHPLNPVKGFATGTQGAPPGWAWVGEEGPELVHMTGGERVLTTSQSMATGLWGTGRGFANGTGPGGQTPAEANPQSPAGAAAEIARESQIARAKTEAGSTDIVGKPILDGLKSLVGKALNLGLHHALDPILATITGKFPQTFGADVKGAIEKPIEGIIDWLVKNDIPQSSGSEENALEFMLKQVGKRYSQASRYGPDSWDCSGLVWGASHQAGIPMPGGPGPNNAAAIVDPELQWVGAQPGSTVITDPKQVQRGDYIGFHASDQGTFGSAKMIDGDYLMVGKKKILTMGHIGMVVDPKTYVSAYDTQMGVITSPIAGDQFGVAVRLGGTAAGPLGGATGSEMQNGIELYQYLKTNLFGGNKIAAAGAIASIWGESTWNPFAQGTGGRGLIGWTPPGTISNAAFNGGMKTQLPAILKFVTSSGDSGVIAEMFRATSILEAANLWGKGVERYGINDVHSQGLALATQIANKYAIGTRWAAPGWAMVGENGAEMINLRGGESILTHEQSLSALSRNPGVQGFAGGTMGHMDMTAKSESASLKSALKDVEKLLQANVKATKGVGGDVAGNLNGKVARPAGNRGTYNNGLG